MAVILRESGSAGARPGGKTVLGRPPVPAAGADALVPTPLDAAEQLHLDAHMARTRRSWADRLAAHEAALAPEAAAGFADRVGAEFDAERQRTLAGLPRRLRAHAASGLSTIGAEIVNSARDYESLAAHVGLFNTAKRATDDLVTLVAHDRTAHDRLRDQGMALLARTSLSDGARTLLGQRHVTEIAHAHAAAHIDDDPADAHAALTTPAGEGPSPYDVLTDEQRQRYAARALTEDARRRATIQFAEMARLEAAIEAGGGSHAEIEGSGLPDTDKRELRDLLDRRAVEEQATAAALARFNEPGTWDPANPADQVAADRVLIALGGDREALARGEPTAHEALLRVAQRTGIVPEVVRTEIGRLVADGTADRRSSAKEVRDVLPTGGVVADNEAGNPTATLAEDRRIIADFEISDAELAAIARETPVNELASWLRRIRSVHDRNATQARNPRGLDQSILDEFGWRHATASLLLDRFRKVREGHANILRHPTMFPPEVVDRYVRSLGRRELVADIVTDFLPVVGDAKAAVAVAGGVAALIVASRSGDGRLIRAAERGLVLALMDLVPVPNVVAASRKVVRLVNGLPVSAAYKRAFHRRMWRQGMLKEDKWKEARADQYNLDNLRYGKLDEEIVARALIKRVKGKPDKYKAVHRRITFWTPGDKRVVADFEIERVDGTRFLIDSKTGRKNAIQEAGYQHVREGRGRRRRKRAPLSPPIPAKYLHRPGIPDGWRRTLWRAMNIGK